MISGGIGVHLKIRVTLDAKFNNDTLDNKTFYIPPDIVQYFTGNLLFATFSTFKDISSKLARWHWDDPTHWDNKE